MDAKEKLHPTEIEVQNRVIDYLVKESGQIWWPPKNKHELHSKGVDIWLKGNKSGTRQFFIECKGRSNAKTQKARDSIDKEGWLVALGQIVTRVKSKRIIESGKTKVRASKGSCYGLALYWKGAQRALYRISRYVSEVLNLYIFSVDEEGYVKMFTPSKFGVEYPDDAFHR